MTDAAVVPFPTKRKRAYPGPPQRWWAQPLPENVHRIREPVPLPEPQPLQPIWYVVLAIMEAMRTDPTIGGRPGIDVLGALQDMQARWTDDPQVSDAVRAAIAVCLARTTGRL